jgi:hypothetical protein
MWPLTLLEACGTLKSSVEKKHVLLISVFLFGFDHYITLPNHGSQPPPLSPSLLVLGKALTKVQCACLLFCNCWNFKKQIVNFFSSSSHIPFTSEPAQILKLHYHSPNELCAWYAWVCQKCSFNPIKGRVVMYGKGLLWSRVLTSSWI